MIKTMFTGLFLCSSLLLSQCGMNEKQVSALVIAKCPVLKNYSRADLQKAAKELAATASDSEISVLLTDYSKMRDACRAIVNKINNG